MKKTLIVGSILALAAIAATPANAQTASVNVRASAPILPPAKAMNQAFRQDMRAIATSTRAEVREIRQDRREFASSTRADIKGLRQEFRDEKKDMPKASTTKAALLPKRADLKAEIESRKMELANKRASTTAMVKERVQDGAAAAIKASEDHFAGELNRFSEIKAKIDSRIAKLQAAGANVTTAQADLALAVSAIADAQTKASSIGDVASTATTTGTTKAAAVKQAIRDMQTAIETIQKAFLKVVADLKTAEATVTATTSASVQ